MGDETAVQEQAAHPEHNYPERGAHPIHPGDLAAVTAAPSAVDSVIAVVAWLKANQSINGDVAGIVTLALTAHRTALEPALVANVNN